MRVLFCVLSLTLILVGCSPDELISLRTQPTVEAQRAVVALATTLPSEPRPTAPVITSAAPVPTLEPAQTGGLAQQQQVFVELYRRVSPAVVSVEGSGAHPQVEGMDVPPGMLPISQGSGFLFDQQGHIVTNNHVIEGSQKFTVTFADGSVVAATVVGSDAGSDLAVLKVDTLPAETASISLNTQEVEVGQTAIAIGNPFGLQNTMTIGVISGIARDLRGPTSPTGGNFAIPNIIQTDAAINPGNSGGPLLNIFGEIVGVNTAISSDSGTFDGVGYAVPAATVARVVPELIRVGVYQHAWLGVSMEQITPQLVELLGLPVRQGLLVMEAIPGGPAATAGLRAGAVGQDAAPAAFTGDIITAIDGRPMISPNDLRSYIETKSIDETVMLTVQRDGAAVEIPLVLEARPGA